MTTATLLSRVLCLLLMLCYLKKEALFTFKLSAFDRSEVLPLIQKAIPSVIQQSIPAVSTTFLTALASTYSVTAIAAYGVAAIVGTYFLMVSIGYILNTVTNCCLGTLNSMGKLARSMFLMLFYYIVVRMPLVYLLSRLGFGVNGIWVAILVSHVVASVAAGVSGPCRSKKMSSHQNSAVFSTSCSRNPGIVAACAQTPR